MRSYFVMLTALAVVLLFGCAGAKSNADFCGDGICADFEDQFSCAVDCGAAQCGNGLIEDGEECDGTNLGGESCSSLGFGSGTLSCHGSCYFDSSACASACVDSCVTGELRCQGDELQGCTLGSQGCLEWSTEQDCGLTGQTCSEELGSAACTGSCVNLCEAGSTRCDGQRVQSCILGESGCLEWVDSMDCGLSGQVCLFEGESASCVSSCSDVCSVSGETQCFGDVVQQCEMGVSGCLEWSDEEQCALSGMICLEDTAGASCALACTDQCVDGQTRCSGALVELCTLQGSGCLDWELQEDCALVGQVCDGGVCACDPVCVIAETRCTGDTVEVCVANGQGCPEWQFSEDCALTGETCSGGSCGFTFTGYTQTTFTGSYATISSNGAAQYIGTAYDDAWGDFAIPPVSFYGNSYSTIWISSNGWVSFGADPLDAYATNLSLPDSGNPQRAIYVFWDDHVVDDYYWTGAGLWLLVEGAIGSRVVTVEWRNTIHYDALTWNDHLANFQVKLYEATGVIELLYDRAQWAGSIDWSGTVGIEDNTLGEYHQVSASLSTAPTQDIRYTP